jgi:type II secretion system protein I
MMSTSIFKAGSSHSGFTLLEVMVAVAIITMALVAALGSQSQSVSLASEAKFSTTAAFLAQGKMAEFETTDPEDLSSDSGDFGDDFPGYSWNAEVRDDTEKQYGWKAEVGYVSKGKTDDPSEYVKIIELTVFWGDQERYKYELVYHRFVPNENE